VHRNSDKTKWFTATVIKIQAVMIVAFEFFTAAKT
jgi:hypothetical protein